MTINPSLHLHTKLYPTPPRRTNSCQHFWNILKLSSSFQHCSYVVPLLLEAENLRTVASSQKMHVLSTV